MGKSLDSRSARAPQLTDLMYAKIAVGDSEGKSTIDEILTLGINRVNTYTKQQYFAMSPITDAANISWDLDEKQVSAVTLTDNRTLDNPTNMKDGATYILRVTQDGTGSRTLAFGAAYKWAGGTPPTLSINAGAIDIITFTSDGASMYGVISADFS